MPPTSAEVASAITKGESSGRHVDGAARLLLRRAEDQMQKRLHRGWVGDEAGRNET